MTHQNARKEEDALQHKYGTPPSDGPSSADHLTMKLIGILVFAALCASSLTAAGEQYSEVAQEPELIVSAHRLSKILKCIMDGCGPFDGARKIADEAMKSCGHKPGQCAPEDVGGACKEGTFELLIAKQCRFSTGANQAWLFSGSFVTAAAASIGAPFSAPAADGLAKSAVYPIRITTGLIIELRMIMAIAYIEGYSLHEPYTAIAAILAYIGEHGKDVARPFWKKAMREQVLKLLAKALAVKMKEIPQSWVKTVVPIPGGLLSISMDYAKCRTAAIVAREWFPQQCRGRRAFFSFWISSKKEEL